MFIRKVQRANGNVSVQLVESYRAGGKPRHRVRRQVGTRPPGPQLDALVVRAKQIRNRWRAWGRPPVLLPDATLAELARAARHHPAPHRAPRRIDPELQEEQCRLVLGGHEIFGALFDEFGLHHTFGAGHPMKRRVFREEVILRLMHPGESKLAHAAHLADAQRAPFDVNRMYRMMDGLDDERIEWLQQRVLEAAGGLAPATPDSVLFLDSTTLSFASERADDLRRKGWSKDGKPHRVQVVLALLLTEAGLPLGYHLFPGNTADVSTLQPAIDDLRRRYGALDMAVVADAGMLSRANIEQLQRVGSHYVVAARLGSIRGADRERITDLERYGPPDAFGVRLLDTEHDGRRLIVRYDPQHAARDRAKRDEAIARAKQRMRDGRIRSHKYLKHDGKTQLDHDRIEHDAALDGLHGVYTSLALDAATVRERYADLWRIEHGFRVIKHDLSTCPMFHWTERRVRAHVALCYVAFALLRHLMHRLHVQGAWDEAFSETRVLNELRNVQASLILYPPTGQHYLMPQCPTEFQKAIYQVFGMRLPARCHRLEEDGEPLYATRPRRKLREKPRAGT